jgi:O-antigen/teichoic acid export membrane protein
MWRNFVRNAFANVGGTLVGLAMGFVTMPLVVHHLGPTQFGLWVLATGLVGYVGILDLGLSPTLVNEAAALLARDEPAARARLSETTSTIFALYFGLGTLGALALGAVGLAAPALFQVAPEDLATFRTVLLVVGLQTALGLPMSVWNGLLAGLQAFHVVNAIGVATTLARGALTIGLVLSGHGLTTLVTSSFAVTLAGWTASAWCAHRRLPGLRVRPSGFRRGRLREIGRFSTAMVVWTIAGAALHQLDRTLIAVVLPVAALTTYEVGARLANYSRTVLHSWLSIVMPATSALAARGERGRLRALFLRSTRYLLASYGGIAVALLGLGGPLVRLWMGDGFAESYVVMSLLVLGSVVQSQNVVAHVMLPGMGELGVFTRFMAVYPIVTAGCAVSGILLGGLVGLAAGTATAMLVMEIAFLRLIVRTRFAVSARRVFLRCHWPVAKALAPVVLWIAAIRLLVPIEGWGTLAAVGVVAGLVFVAGVWTTVMTAGERRVARERLLAMRTRPEPARLSPEASC